MPWLARKICAIGTLRHLTSYELNDYCIILSCSWRLLYHEKSSAIGVQGSERLIDQRSALRLTAFLFIVWGNNHDLRLEYSTTMLSSIIHRAGTHFRV